MSAFHKMPEELYSFAKLQESQNKAGKTYMPIKNSLVIFANQRA